jgi:hypothetical protein
MWSGRGDKRDIILLGDKRGDKREGIKGTLLFYGEEGIKGTLLFYGEGIKGTLLFYGKE